MTKAILSGATLALGSDLGLTIAMCHPRLGVVGHMVPASSKIGAEPGPSDLIATVNPGTEFYSVEALTANGKAFIALL